MDGGYKNMKKVLVALLPGMLENIDRVAAAEHRNRSDAVRQACREYCANHDRKEAELRAVRAAAFPVPQQ